MHGPESNSSARLRYISNTIVIQAPLINSWELICWNDTELLFGLLPERTLSLSSQGLYLFCTCWLCSFPLQTSYIGRRLVEVALALTNKEVLSRFWVRFFFNQFLKRNLLLFARLKVFIIIDGPFVGRWFEGRFCCTTTSIFFTLVLNSNRNFHSCQILFNLRIHAVWPAVILFCIYVVNNSFHGLCIKHFFVSCVVAIVCFADKNFTIWQGRCILNTWFRVC